MRHSQDCRDAASASTKQVSNRAHHWRRRVVHEGRGQRRGQAVEREIQLADECAGRARQLLVVFQGQDEAWGTTSRRFAAPPGGAAAFEPYADRREDRQADPGDVGMSRSAVHTTMESDADAATNTCARPKATGASGSRCQQRMPTAATRLPTRCISQRANKSPGPAELR